MKFDRFEKFNVGQDIKLLPKKDIEEGSIDGMDCTQRCLPYVRSEPLSYALVTGHIRVAMIDKQKGIQVEDSLAWNTPYRCHTWIEDVEGRIYDPSLENLAAYCANEANMMQLPKPIEELRAVRNSDTERKQLYTLERMDKETTSCKVETHGVDIVYFPGLFYELQNDPRPEKMQWIEVHQCHNTRANGGFYNAKVYDQIIELADQEFGSDDTDYLKVLAKESNMNVYAFSG